MIIQVFLIAITLISFFGLIGEKEPFKALPFALVTTVGMISTLIISLFSH